MGIAFELFNGRTFDEHFSVESKLGTCLLFIVTHTHTQPNTKFNRVDCCCCFYSFRGFAFKSINNERRSNAPEKVNKFSHFDSIANFFSFFTTIYAQQCLDMQLEPIIYIRLIAFLNGFRRNITLYDDFSLSWIAFLWWWGDELAL